MTGFVVCDLICRYCEKPLVKLVTPGMTWLSEDGKAVCPYFEKRDLGEFPMHKPWDKP